MSLTVSNHADLPPDALAELQQALLALQPGTGLVERITAVLVRGLGTVVGTAAGGFGMGQWAARAVRFAPGMQGLAQAALTQAFNVAILGLPDTAAGVRQSASGSRVVVAASGALGGAAGLAGFVPDAAVTTLTIMRRIGQIAREEGEDLESEDSRRACLEVFALKAGTLPGTSPTAGEGGYYETRLLLQGAPLLRLMAEVASRYGVQLGQKLAAQAVPIAGALTGVAINSVFLAQFERLARAHFTVRRLERVWGEGSVNAASVKLGIPR